MFISRRTNPGTRAISLAAWNLRGINSVYVDQSAGKGMSLGPSTVSNEEDVAHQFIDFWKRFVDTFDLHGGKGALMYNPLTNTFDLKMQGCDLWGDIVEAATYVNPCFNICHLTDYCPILWNIMGFLSSDAGPSNYFNRSDVQKAINIQPTSYIVCTPDEIFQGKDHRDQSKPSSMGHPTERHPPYQTPLSDTESQGFQKLPTEPLFAPYHPKYAEFVGENSSDPPPSTHIAGSGFLGLVHTKRPPQHGGYGRTP
ncbi:uncharacterized protein ATNIH1004_000770 [Aspergillus tanneri]|uniref:Uncharacterized protein n=1 Tax=Aspergillus tanneri TaxID=1220188 RepID=A0A5M9MXP5_9EURO|nr:uncharacterized protein ATNIH1004_000770 [Aspergillus tanneri]KAA8651872.1 hypothetical protein ATNIH1004_000770 [Aspergillus tanneri]